MASLAKNFALFLLIITLLSSLHSQARDINPNTKNPPNNQEQEPNFLPEKENPYGLYGQNSGEHPHPATTTAAAAATPYDLVPYVTNPEDISDSTESNNYYNDGQNYYNNQQNEEEEYRAAGNNRQNDNYYYNGGGFSGGATLRHRESYFNGDERDFQQQGMSDTRFLENGKYSYDVNTEKYSNNHPYERLRRIKARNEYNNKMMNYYGNGENAFEFSNENSMGGYQNQYEFQDEENNMP